ncbi:MAG: 50S ribosomal protein L13 [Patescibacteria group bacterium]
MPWKKRVGIPRIKRETIEIDAAGKPVGRVATRIAMVLMGKHKPNYNPQNDTGDRVVVKNAEKAVFTGNKETQKVYFRTSNRPGGLKTTPVRRAKEEDPNFIIRHAVRYMLPKNKLQDLRMKRLTFIK